MAEDETKGTPGDESKGKGTPGDESKGTPKKDKGKLFTQVAIDKLKSDAAAMGQGRAEKAAAQEKEALTSELESIKGRFDALEAQANETRLAEARGDPVKLQAYQRDQTVGKREQAVADKERDLVRREGLLKTDRAELDKDRGVVSVAYVAAKHGLDPERLEKLKITDPEALERVAEELVGAKGKGEGEGGEEGEEGAEGEEHLELDTGETTGGAGTLAALEKANEDFQAGKITEKQLQEASDKVPDKVK